MFHPLHYDGEWPAAMNNPFDYEPHAVCRQAVSEALPAIRRLMEGVGEGKMFGVLVVEKEPDATPCGRGFLMAFSGQIGDSASWPGFVPPVYDYLQPDGYFKQEEARITALNRQMTAITTDSTYLYLLRTREALRQEAQTAVLKAQTVMRMGKKLRDERRREGFLSAAEQEEMIRESQYQKAELHRTRQRYAGREDELQTLLEPY
jgi:tRNA pseudouridine32 synthase/23S rRNA pseudouridine746 synthase